MSGLIVDNLNYDFQYNLYLAKISLVNLPKPEDRQKVTFWIQKLSQSNRSLDELKLRNDFMYFLVLQLQNGVLQEPFTDKPPSGPLPLIKHLLPAQAQGQSDPSSSENLNKDKSILYENSPDGGAFLASQPVPRSGAFCYLAVIARGNKP